MRLITQPNGVVSVISTSRMADVLCLLGVGGCAWLTIRETWRGSYTLNDFAPLIGSALFLVGLLAGFERARFDFDPAIGGIRWSRNRIFSKEGGILPFTRVKSVVLQTAIGSSAVAPSYRLALITDQGEQPLTIAYAKGMRQEYETIAGTIRGMLNLRSASSDLTMDSIRAAAAEGKVIDAIRLARLNHGLDLTEAKQMVDQLRQPSHLS